MQHKVLDKENVVCVKIINAMFALFKKQMLMWWLFFWHLTCLTPALQAGPATSRDKGFAVGVHLLFELAICRDGRGRRFSSFQLRKQWQPQGKARSDAAVFDTDCGRWDNTLPSAGPGGCIWVRGTTHRHARRTLDPPEGDRIEELELRATCRNYFM